MVKENKRSNKKEVDDEMIAKGEAVVGDFSEAESLYVPAKKRQNKLISIRLPMTMLKDLQKVAETKGDIGYQQIIKTYIADGLMRNEALSQPSEIPFYCQWSMPSSSSSIAKDLSQAPFGSGEAA